jgi:hypothetical protein
MYPPDASETPDTEVQQHHSPELELELLRAGVRKMTAQRAACSRCGRSLLVGERVQVFAAAGEESQICALCLAIGAAESSIGEPVRTERVPAGERPLSVRRAA